MEIGFTTTSFRQIRDREKIVVIPRYDGAFLDARPERLPDCGFDGNLLLAYTYLCGYWGIPAAMKRDSEKIRKQVEAR